MRHRTRRGARRALGAPGITALTIAALTIAALALAAGACSGDDASRSTPVPGGTSTTIMPTTTTRSESDQAARAEVFVEAWRFTSSVDGSTALAAQSRLVADCMAERGLSYEAEIAVPGAAADDAADYGLVDYFLAAGQDRENEAIESGLSPTDALAWREALNGPPRSQNEDVPVSDDPDVVGCGPAALPRFVGVEHAAALSELVSSSVALREIATQSESVVAARTAHDECLLAAGVGLAPSDVANGFAAFPVIRDWFGDTFVDDPATLRAAVADGDPTIVAPLTDLHARERTLFAADRACDATADPTAALDAEIARLSREDAAAAGGDRDAFVAALDAARDAARAAG